MANSPVLNSSSLFIPYPLAGEGDRETDGSGTHADGWGRHSKQELTLNHMVGNRRDDDEQHRTGKRRDRDEVTLVLEPVGSEAEAEDADKGGSVQGDGVVLANVSGPTESADKRRHKVLDRLSTGAQHVHDDKHPGPPVSHSEHDCLPVADLLARALGRGETVVSESLSGENFLLLGEPFRRGGPIWQNHPRKAADKGRRDALY